MDRPWLETPGPAFFLWVRRAVPFATALGALGAAGALPDLRGWLLLLAAAALAEVGGTFRKGRGYLAHRARLLRWDGLWVRALRPLARWAGLEEAWIQSFCAWNNARIASVFALEPARRALVLLPHCIQKASCRVDAQSAITACPGCGQCPVGDVLAARLAERWNVRLFNRSYKAYVAAREYQADLVVAVSCTDRLLKGLLSIPELPAVVIPLRLPHGMCVDTTFDLDRVEAALEALAVSSEREPGRIQPLRSAREAS